MRGIPHVVRRGTMYHFRRVVPADVRAALGRTELVRSLQTADSLTAQLRAHHLYVVSEKLIRGVRGPSMLTEEMLTHLVQDFYGTFIEKDDRDRLMSEEPLAATKRQMWIDYYNLMLKEAKEDLASNAFGSTSLITEGMLLKHGLKGKFTYTEIKKIRQAMLRAAIDLAEALKARYEGDFNYEPKDAYLRKRLAGFNMPVAPKAEAEQADKDRNLPCLSSIAPAFCKDQVSAQLWENQTALQARKTYELFIECCGDRPLTAYQQDDADRFKDVLQQLPANYGKAAEYRGLRIEEIVARFQEAGGNSERLNPRTVKRHIAAMSALWGRAVKRKEVPANLFSGYEFPSGKRANQQRSMWTREELKALFSTPIWTGCKSAFRRTKQGPYIIRDEYFWIPLIAVFSGMREEEICQLHIEDIRVIEGIHVFDVNQVPPRKLKNKHSVRIVPVHSELIRIGFLEFVEEQRRSGQRLLFSGLTPGGADNRLGHNFTKWFTRYRQDVGLYRKQLDFHSFRHSATTFLKWANVRDSVIDALTGHATPGETTRYHKGFEIGQLKQAIDTISIDADLSHLYVDGRAALP